MKGLRISRVPRGVALEQARFEDRLRGETCQLLDRQRDTADVWLGCLEPFWLTDFGRFFGPLFPELLSRRWLLCEADTPMVTAPFAMLEAGEGGARSRRTAAELGRLKLASGDGWILASGEYLLRIAHHLDEDELTFFGLPADRWQALSPEAGQDRSLGDWAALAERHSDLILTTYEGIWGAFFSDPKLLARTFFHCSEQFIVYEIEAGVGVGGNWLTRCHHSCPNLPLLLSGH